MKSDQLLFMMSSACPVKCRVSISVESGSHYVQLNWAWRVKKKWLTRTIEVLLCELGNVKKLTSVIQDARELGWEQGDE